MLLPGSDQGSPLGSSAAPRRLIPRTSAAVGECGFYPSVVDYIVIIIHVLVGHTAFIKILEFLQIKLFVLLGDTKHPYFPPSFSLRDPICLT